MMLAPPGAALRILLINYEFPPIGAGAGNATANIARELADLGTRVLVLTARYRGLPQKDVQDGFEIVRAPALRRRPDRATPLEMLTFMLGGILPALSIGRRWRPDVCCAFFGLPSGPLALLLRRQFGIPYLVSLRGGDVPGFLQAELGRWHRVTAPLIGYVWRRSAGLVANSAGLAELARRLEPEVPVAVVPNGVDLRQFAPPAAGRPPTPLRILFAGRLVRQKGVRHLLEGFAESGVDAALRIIGDGPERAHLQELAVALDIARQVEFHGWVSRADLIQHYRWANVFVLATFEEGMANALLEAMGAGLAIVTTDIYGNTGLVRDGENGLLVSPGSSAELAAALRRLAGAPELVRAMGYHSRQRALDMGWDSVARAYLELLHAAAAGQDRLLARAGPGAMIPPATGA